VGEHAAGVGDEVHQHRILLGRERNLLPGLRDRAPLEVDAQVAELDGGALSAPAAWRNATRTRASSSFAPNGLAM
jgi:hypothetical protein